MRAIKLAAPRRYALYATAIGLWSSGAAWLVAHYFLQKQGEYGPQTSPLEPWSLKLHGAFAMLGLWFMGLLWGVHVVRGWQARRGRLTGAMLLGALGLLVLTGYLLYYLGDEDLRADVSLVHWLLGLAGLPLFLWHRFSRKRVRLRPPAAR